MYAFGIQRLSFQSFKMVLLYFESGRTLVSIMNSLTNADDLLDASEIQISLETSFFLFLDILGKPEPLELLPNQIF